MLIATTVSTDEELVQVHQLNKQNLKQNISLQEKEKEGFVTWLYSPQLLKSMHNLAPKIIVKDGATVAGYALTTLKEASNFHPI
jgi:UDP-N-acetylglucosamine:LPS N-acetylglucosamine transferase